MRRLMTCALSCAVALTLTGQAYAATNESAQPGPVYSASADLGSQDPIVPVPQAIAPIAESTTAKSASPTAAQPQVVAMAASSETDALSMEAGASTAVDAQPASPLSDLLMWGVPTTHQHTSVASSARVPHGIERLTDGFMNRTRMLVTRITESAMHFIGTPYSFGGTSSVGFDCSGYVQRVFATVGIFLPRTADEQYMVGRRVDTAHAKRGDLVFFQTYAPGASHVGIYLGNNEFIHSSSSHGVMVSSLNDRYWSSRFIGIERVLGNKTAHRLAD